MTRSLLVLPAVLFVLFGCIVPLACLAVFSFFTVDEMDLIPSFSLASWSNLILQPVYATLIGKAALTGFFTALSAALFGYPMALAIWYLSAGWRSLMLMVLLTPLYTGELVRLYAWRLVLGAEGMLNSLLIWVRLVDKPVQVLLFSPLATHLVLFYNNLPFMVLCLWISLELLDRNLVEAARDLGARKMQIFGRIILPMTIPGLASGSIICFALSTGDLLTPQAMGGTSGATVMTLVDSLFGTAFDWPMASTVALAFIATLLGIVVFTSALSFRLPGVRAVLRGISR